MNTIIEKDDNQTTALTRIDVPCFNFHSSSLFYFYNMKFLQLTKTDLSMPTWSTQQK